MVKNAANFLILLLILILGCETPEMEKVSQPLIGEWLWVESSGGFAGTTILPKDNERVLLAFHKNGTFTIKLNGKETETGNYTVELQPSIFNQEQTYLLVYKNGISQGFQFEQKKLYLTDEVYDGFSHTYVKNE